MPAEEIDISLGADRVDGNLEELKAWGLCSLPFGGSPSQLSTNALLDLFSHLYIVINLPS